MKRTILTLSIMLISLLTISTSVQSQSKNTDTTNQNAPVITFDNLVHDYGSIPKGGDGNCVFTFKNTGNEPLVLSNVTTSCGCTIPSWNKEPILPGKTGVIKVNYTRTNTVGIISKQITVTSNAKNGTIILSIKGTVVENTNNGTSPEKQPDQILSPQK
jgi:hypothetical protein